MTVHMTPYSPDGNLLANPVLSAVWCNQSILIPIQDKICKYNLKGVVYFGDGHYTSKIIINHDQVWFHDGISTGHELQYDGLLHSTSFLTTPHPLDLGQSSSSLMALTSVVAERLNRLLFIALPLLSCVTPFHCVSSLQVHQNSPSATCFPSLTCAGHMSPLF